MTKLVKKPGDVFSFPLSGELIGFAQWLPDGTARIFSLVASGPVAIEAIVASPLAFRVPVYKDTPGIYGWKKLGRAEIPPEFASPQRYAKRDSISGALSIYFEGVETPATVEQLSGLETLAVWAHPHLVERLEAFKSDAET